jgi:hypothetical protein
MAIIYVLNYICVLELSFTHVYFHIYLIILVRLVERWSEPVKLDVLYIISYYPFDMSFPQ